MKMSAAVTETGRARDLCLVVTVRAVVVVYHRWFSSIFWNVNLALDPNDEYLISRSSCRHYLLRNAVAGIHQHPSTNGLTVRTSLKTLSCTHGRHPNRHSLKVSNQSGRLLRGRPSTPFIYLTFFLFILFFSLRNNRTQSLDAPIHRNHRIGFYSIECLSWKKSIRHPIAHNSSDSRYRKICVTLDLSSFVFLSCLFFLSLILVYIFDWLSSSSFHAWAFTLLTDSFKFEWMFVLQVLALARPPTKCMQ